MVRSLFDILRAERASGRVSTLRDWLARHPIPDDRFTLTLAGIPDRVRAGVPFVHATREFLDEFSFRPGVIRQEAIDERPELLGLPHQDAYLAALAEHLATVNDLARPSWTADPERFCDRFWFASDVKGFRALLIATSPAAFRRRGLFVSPRTLTRV